jgi:hypothetical protein
MTDSYWPDRRDRTAFSTREDEGDGHAEVWWNTLRVGDAVLVTARGRDLATAGAVVTVDEPNQAAPTELGCVGSPGRHEVLWPSFLAVHRDPFDPTDGCWRCDSSPQLPDEQLGIPHPRDCPFKAAMSMQGQSDSVSVLSAEGSQGWRRSA